jgi:2-polyprenyl-3-methyl-5-hydroxy-6-metoxy-1,4-benzoquinol methylase
MTTAEAPGIDETKLHAFVGKALTDMGAAMSASLTVIGDKLGLYKALHEYGPLNSPELAERTGTHERYVREWLAAQAAGGYVEYDPETRRFTLPPEQALMLADETSPLYVQGAFQVIEAAIADEPHIADAFKTGRGFGWHERDARLFEGTERFFQPGYNAHIIAEWIPALGDVDAKLRAGAKVADVGCGLGASTIVMAKEYPKSTFTGFDYHQSSIELARERATAADVAETVGFGVASAQDFAGGPYDFIACFNCLHDMGDPVGGAKHILAQIKPGGTWLLVEPYANDNLEENLNPIGRIFYAASTLLSTPASLSQNVGLALGAQAGEARLREVAIEAGFRRFRRAAQTPFNLVFEIRP